MRFQLALNVKDLDEATTYYSKLLRAPVNKKKPVYANFAVDSPPIKLVLFENREATERLNHVGFEMMEIDEVESAISRLEPQGLADQVIRDETCCYAEKSTVYSKDPEWLLWEFYKVRGDADDLQASTPVLAESTPDEGKAPAGCCLEPNASEQASSGRCC